ncbi:MAG: hypothetical protein WA807_11625 [Steroidobacteraceae bacterium]
MDSGPAAGRSARLARRALVGFIFTFIAARTVVLLIMSHRMPNLYFFLRGTHVHHLNYGIFLLAGVSAYLLFRAPAGEDLSVDAVILVAAVLALIAFAPAIRSFETRHLKASIAILIALVGFGAVVYDASLQIGRLEGPRLEALELSSSP